MVMLGRRKFANYRLDMRGITQNKQKYFKILMRLDQKEENSTVENKQINKQIKLILIIIKIKPSWY